MAQVLSPYLFSTDSSSPFASNPLRRSSSHSSFVVEKSSSQLNTPARSGYCDIFGRPYSSNSSIAPSSPRFQELSTLSPSCTSASSLSLDDCNDTDVGDVDYSDIEFPSYDTVGYYDEKEDEVTQYSFGDTTDVPKTCTPVFESPFADYSTKKLLRRPMGLSGDDTIIEHEPTRHVDYLSHERTEEEIWSSWRHIVSRRGMYNNSPRLENAAWRSWAKKRNNLPTVSPESLNWMKDCDVTWLYGPSLSCSVKSMISDPSPPPSRTSDTGSYLNKKPILKKRTASEAMLQKSISANMLLKHATTVLKAQQQHSMYLGKWHDSRSGLDSDLTSPLYVPSSVISSVPSAMPSVASSGLQTPSEKKHIHFNNEVVQYIAIDGKCGDDGEDDAYANTYDEYDEYDSNDDDDDDGVIMMKSMPSRLRIESRNSTPRNSFSSESKIIAPLPPTTLKYRGDTPEPVDQSERMRKGGWLTGTPTLSARSSVETLRPSTPMVNFLLDDDGDDAGYEWQPCASSSNGDDKSNSPNDRHSNTMLDSNEERPGMHRTESGMFMPYSPEDDIASAGLFGKVVDTVNTARDIANVIWNVGWRR